MKGKVPCIIIKYSPKINCIFYPDAHRVQSKISDVYELGFTESYDIIGLTEMWLIAERRHLITEYKLPGYIMSENIKKEAVFIISKLFFTGPVIKVSNHKLR